MQNIAYPLFYQLYLSRIRESLPSPRYGRSPSRQLREWTDEELLHIRRVLRRVAGLRVENPEDAEDLVQETLLTMTKRCPEIEVEKGLLIWGMGILRNKLGNYYRRIHRQEPFIESHASGTNGSRAPAPEQESALRYSELRELIDGIIENFDPRERQVLHHFLSGMPTHEIVRRLHPERYQNVINWLFRGRKKLARELVRHGYGKGRSRRQESGVRSQEKSS
jgi:RNA polymerase sigma factor (sigma-70 family)